jgi:hypothetical protein
LWPTSMTDQQEAIATEWRFFRTALKNPFAPATFHLSDALNEASIATS